MVINILCNLQCVFKDLLLITFQKTTLLALSNMCIIQGRKINVWTTLFRCGVQKKWTNQTQAKVTLDGQLVLIITSRLRRFQPNKSKGFVFSRLIVGVTLLSGNVILHISFTRLIQSVTSKILDIFQTYPRTQYKKVSLSAPKMQRIYWEKYCLGQIRFYRYIRKW